VCHQRRFGHSLGTRRAGLTLVELTFLIALIAVAFLIASKWTFRTRVDERRYACLANMRAIALATLNYEHSHGSFPSGMIWSLEPGAAARESALRTGAGALVGILPFLDQSQAYAATNFDLPIHSPPNTTVCGWDFGPPFACPADTAYMASAIDNALLAGGVAGSTHRVSKSSYAFVAGPWVANTWKIHGVGAGERSSYPEIARNQLGIFNVHSNVRLADIHDGTSNTLLVGERSLQALPDQARRDSFWWFSGNHGDTLMTTMFPPVIPGTGYPAEIAALSPSSQHEGLVQFAYADGSVRPTVIDPGATVRIKPLPVPRQRIPHLQGFVTPQFDARPVGPDPFWDTVFQLKSGSRFTLLQRLSTRAGDDSSSDAGL
jgi:hypothetical protein